MVKKRTYLLQTYLTQWRFTRSKLVYCSLCVISVYKWKQDWDSIFWHGSLHNSSSLTIITKPYFDIKLDIFSSIYITDLFLEAGHLGTKIKNCSLDLICDTVFFLHSSASFFTLYNIYSSFYIYHLYFLLLYINKRNYRWNSNP